MRVWEEIDLRLFALRFGRQSRVHVQESVSHDPRDERRESQNDEHPYVQLACSQGLGTL